MKKPKLTKALSLLMALALALSLVPATALATEDQPVQLEAGTVVLAEDQKTLAEAIQDVLSGGQQDDAAPAEDETPAEDQTPAEDETPVEDETPAEDQTPAEDETPAEEEPPVEEPPVVEDPVILEEPVIVEEPVAQVEPMTVEELRSARDTANDSFYKILHLDCGRKYFSAANINAIIDLMAENGFNQLELAFGNAGLRFLLDDMSLGEIPDAVVRAAVEKGNAAQNDSGDESYLTENDMASILKHADEKGIDIVPLLNMPGHMNAFLYLKDGAYKLSGSNTSLNLADANAYNLGLELLQKYVNYFSGKVNYFSFGADEFGNDISNPYIGGTGAVGYATLVDYMNACAQIIINGGMTPRAFNDFFYYNGISSPAPNSDVQICYWNNQWASGSPYVRPDVIAQKGHEMINTNSHWYYVPGTGYTMEAAQQGMKDYKYDVYRVEGTDGQQISGDTTKGAMVCIWCDKPNADTEANIVTAAGELMSGFAAANPSLFEEKVTVSSGDVSVTAAASTGITGVTVTEAAAPEIKGAKNVVAYNIVPMVGSEKYTGKADVTLPVPEGWNSSKVKAYVVEEDNSITPIEGTYADGKYTFTVPHFSVAGLYESDPVDVAENKTITVTVNGTATATIEGADYSALVDRTELDASIATVSAKHTQVPAGKEPREVTAIESGKQYLIVNTRANKLLTDEASGNGRLLDGALSADSTELWTITGSGSGYTVKNTAGKYLTINDGSASMSNNSATLNLAYKNGTWTIAQTVTSGSGWWASSDTYYLNQYGGGSSITAAGWNGSGASTDDGSQWKIYEVVSSAAVEVTEVTFTGVAAGTTYVTVGNTRYTINVVEEDLSAVTPKTIVYLITGLSVKGSDGNTSKTVSAQEAYGETGVAISDLVPETGTYKDDLYNVKYWKTQYLTGADRLPSDAGWTNHSNKGTTITHIRYYNSQWSVKTADGNWIDVDDNSDLAAYYLHETNVTQEVTTYVVDWGDDWSAASGLRNSYGLYDFAVVYPSSANRDPSAYGNDNTMLFNAGGQKDYAVSDSNGTGRYVNQVQVEASEEYEVYMITAIRANLSPTEISSSYNYTAAYSQNYYTANEQIIWVDDESSIPEGTAMQKYEEYYHVGGDPTIPVMKLYMKQAILFTYYLRVKPTADSLSVHYIDQSTNSEFYGYDIAVTSGITFDENIGLANPWKANLVNGSVTNSVGKTETVTADLSQMAAIGAQYRYSDYTCVKVERSNDGKDVFLYYTFNNAHSFVVDFGLPLKITTADLKISGDWTSAQVLGAQYGIATAKVGEGITYTPNKTLQGVETLTLTLTGDEQSTTHNIYIYPATTVYYEEGFASYSNGWTGNASTGSGTQATQIAGQSTDVYGYDAKYANEGAGASNGTQATSEAKGDKATFSFTGTGVDVYANSTTADGWVMIQVKQGTKTVKVLQSNTKMAAGDNAATGGQAVNAYNVPVASITGLSHGDYTVVITNAKDGQTINLDGFRVYNTLATEPDFYTADDEDKPTFIELRDQVLAGLSVTSTGSSQTNAALPTGANAVIVANSADYTQENLDDLLNNGPKNEIYLQPQQALVLTITTEREVQVGLKALNAETSCTINNETKNISTSTDMFYTVLNKGTSGDQTITITNKGDGILAVTKLKVCDDPNATLGTLTEEDLAEALVSLGIQEEPAQPEQPTQPEQPSKPDKPSKPDQPAKPDRPGHQNPVQPGGAQKPGRPVWNFLWKIGHAFGFC